MKTLKSLSFFSPFITKRIQYGYLIYDILESKDEKRMIKTDPKAFHLNVLKMEKFDFNEKVYSIMVTESTRQGQSLHTFERIVRVGQKNIEKIQSFLTISTLLTQMFLQGYTNKKVIKKFTDKGFGQLRNYKSLTFFELKFIICIEKLLGLETYTNEDYQTIHFGRFKPLYLVFVMEIFYKNRLEKKYPFVEKILQYFVANEQYIPFGDISHMYFAARTIRDQRFGQAFNRMRKKVRNFVGSNEDLSLLEEEEMSDQDWAKKVRTKLISHIDNQTGRQFFQQFKQDLQKKYQTMH